MNNNIPQLRETRALPHGHPASQTVLHSNVLLGRHNEVEIIHQGETYRLRRTRQDKLILTK